MPRNMLLKSKTLCTSALEELKMENSAPIPADPLALGATTIRGASPCGPSPAMCLSWASLLWAKGSFYAHGGLNSLPNTSFAGIFEKAAYSQGFRSLTEFLDCAARKSGKELSQTYLNCATQSFPANVEWRLIYPGH